MIEKFKSTVPKRKYNVFTCCALLRATHPFNFCSLFWNERVVVLKLNLYNMYIYKYLSKQLNLSFETAHL